MGSSSAALAAQGPRSYAALAGALMAGGDLDTAAAYLQRLVDDAGGGEDEAEAEACENLGLLHARRGVTAEAVRSLQRAEGVRSRLVAEGRGSRQRLDRVRCGMDGRGGRWRLR